MASLTISILLGPIIISIFAPGIFCNLCEDEFKVKLDGPEEPDGTIQHQNILYPKEAFWKDGDDIFGCPCLVQFCIRQCTQDLATNLSLSVPGDNFEMEIWQGENSKSVELHDHFLVLRESNTCKSSIQLNPEFEDYFVLFNGSLNISHSGGEFNTILPFEDYCILTDNGKIEVLECMDYVEGFNKDISTSPNKSVKFYIYPVFMIISILFLLMTIVAYYLTPEMKTLQGKCIVCQAATLMLAFFGFVVSYLTGSFSHIIVCRVFAYISYYNLLSSFFWLNCMCFEIFWSLRNGSGKESLKLKIYSAYSSLTPLAMFLIVILLEEYLDRDSHFRPGLGATSCWFRSRTAEFIYFHGPILVLLIVNAVFCVWALTLLHKLKKEMMSARENQRGTGNSTKESAILYGKLFILMGGTWLLELLSWLIGGPEEIWILSDIINCSRGVLIFVICVWFNLKVRQSLLTRLWPSKFTASPPLAPESSDGLQGIEIREIF